VTDRSELSIPTVPREGCRHPEERDAFHRRYVRMRLPSCVGLSLTPPTLFPQAGESAVVRLCKRHGAVTRVP